MHFLRLKSAGAAVAILTIFRRFLAILTIFSGTVGGGEKVNTTAPLLGQKSKSSKQKTDSLQNILKMTVLGLK